eukprot:gene13271-17781_t
MTTNSVNVRSTAASGSQVYESKRAVHEYMLFHYGLHKDQFPFGAAFGEGPLSALNFPQRCAKLCGTEINGNLRALDIGCAVGGSTFELARSFSEVIGIDFSHHFIEAANLMKQGKCIEFEIQKQGSSFQKCEASLASDIDVSRVQFLQGDACNLDQDLGQFDVILASNLLCRLPSPRKFLKDIKYFLKNGGKLVLISPYSWLEEYTPKERWIGGTADKESFEELQLFFAENAKELNLVHKEDVPFLIREHERKYQYGVSDCSIWQKTV